MHNVQEIATGKAFQQTKKTFMDASDRFITMTEPHVKKAKVVLMPIMESAAVKFQSAREAISSQLQKEQYRALLEFAQKTQASLLATWVRTKDLVAGIYDSDMVRTVAGYRLETSMDRSARGTAMQSLTICGYCLQIRQARDDLTQVYTLLLGANVSGSGIDLAIPAMMAKYTLFATPVLLLLPVIIMCCSRPRKHTQPPKAIKPKGQPGTSKGGEGKRSKRR